MLFLLFTALKILFLILSLWPIAISTVNYCKNLLQEVTLLDQSANYIKTGLCHVMSYIK